MSEKTSADLISLHSLAEAVGRRGTSGDPWVGCQCVAPLPAHSWDLPPATGFLARTLCYPFVRGCTLTETPARHQSNHLHELFYDRRSWGKEHRTNKPPPANKPPATR